MRKTAGLWQRQDLWSKRRSAECRLRLVIFQRFASLNSIILAIAPQLIQSFWLLVRFAIGLDLCFDAVLPPELICGTSRLGLPPVSAASY